MAQRTIALLGKAVLGRTNLSGGVVGQYYFTPSGGVECDGAAQSVSITYGRREDLGGGSLHIKIPLMPPMVYQFITSGGVEVLGRARNVRFIRGRKKTYKFVTVGGVHTTGAAKSLSMAYAFSCSLGVEVGGVGSPGRITRTFACSGGAALEGDAKNIVRDRDPIAVLIDREDDALIFGSLELV